MTTSEAETARVARGWTARLRAGDVVLLYGDLGSGKTAFVRGIAEGLGVDPEGVSSPTFTIIQQYGGGRVPLLHVDLYRLEPRDVDDLGLDELGADAVLAIEWAERLPRTPPGRAFRVALRHAGDTAREISLDRAPADLGP